MEADEHNTTYHDNLRKSRIKEMKPLINGAKEAGLWFHIHTFNGSEYWFSPDELEAHQQEGRHLYSVVLWGMLDPNLKVKSLEKKIELYQQQLETFKARIK